MLLLLFEEHEFLECENIVHLHSQITVIARYMNEGGKWDKESYL